MRRSGGYLWALVLCALFALAVLDAIALASPGHRSAPRPGASHARSCKRKAHTRTRLRQRSHCPLPRGGSKRAHAKVSPTSPAPSGGSSPAEPSSGAPAAPTLSSPAPAQPLPGPSEPSKVPSSTPPSIPHVQVTAVEYHFTLSRTNVPAGKVIFDFVNHGQDEHNLNVAPGEEPAVGSLANAPAKGVEQLQLQLRPGTYTLFCSLPEHEKIGMKATLVVE